MPPRSLERGGWAPPPPGTAEEEGTGWRGRGRATKAVLRASRTARSIGTIKTKQEAGRPPSQARSPAQQGPGRRHKEHRRPGLCPGGLARRCLSSIICWALRKLFSLNRVSVGRAEPTWVSVLVSVPAVGDFSSHFKDSPTVGWGPCPGPLPRPQLPSPGLRWEQHGGAEPRVSAALGEGEGSSGLVGSFGGILAERLPPGDSCVHSNCEALSPALGCHCRGATRSFDETSSN